GMYCKKCGRSIDEDGLNECAGCSKESTHAATCTHPTFTAEVDVNRITDRRRFTAGVRVLCTACGRPFRFIGLPSRIDSKRPGVNVFGTNVMLPIEPAEEWLAPQPSPLGLPVAVDPTDERLNPVAYMIGYLAGVYGRLADNGLHA